MIPRISIYILVPFLFLGSLLHLAHGSSKSIAANERRQGNKYSSQGLQEAERRQSDFGHESEESEPGRGGPQRYHPQSNLPPYGFSGAPSDDDRGSGPSDTENLGFAGGPPKGFPTFEEIEASFPKLEGSGSGGRGRPSTSHSYEEPQYNSKPQRRHPSSSHASQRPIEQYPSGEATNEQYYEGSPEGHPYSPEDGPNSLSGIGSYGGRPGPYSSSPTRDSGSVYPYQGLGGHFSEGPYGHPGAGGSQDSYENEPQHHERHQPSHYPQEPSQYHNTQGSHRQPEVQHSPQYLTQGHHHHQSQPNRPIVLKVSSLKNHDYHAGKLPAGPSVFYAPSPDVQNKKHRRPIRHRPSQQQRHRHNPVYHQDEQHYQGQSSVEGHPGGSIEYDSSNQAQRYKRATVEGSTTTTPEPTTPMVSSTNNETESTTTTTITPSHNETETSLPTKEPLKRKDAAIDSPKKKKSLSLGDKKKLEVDPMVADGSEQENFWDMPSPFIMFDTYKKHGVDQEEEAATQEESDLSHIPLQRHVARPQRRNQQVNSHQVQPVIPASGNVTFHDSNSEEQRFFPSFPSPYLGLSPFGGGAPARAPLFPGPSANRAPSRYHPNAFGGGPKFSPPSHPNRGPSTVAASHDRYQDTNILGSGNFEVVRGGTYYGDEDEGPSYHHGTTGGGNTGSGGGGGSYDDEDGYYHHNGHSSPYRGGGGDFFANFRDFADINPHSRSFSHNHETHHAASELSSQKQSQPKNIFEKLDIASSDAQPQFSMEYDPMMATF